jgi:hypothetical protein
MGSEGGRDGCGDHLGRLAYSVVYQLGMGIHE